AYIPVMEKSTETKNRDHFLRELLKNEFHRRTEKNPTFSMRAFSLKLGIDQSLLSKLLQGKRSFSEDVASKITNFLGIYLNSKATPASTSENSGIKYH